MITGFFITILAKFLELFLSVLPVQPFPTQIHDAILSAWGFVNAFSYIFPVATLLQVLAIAMVYHGAILLWRLSHLVGGYLRGR